MNTFPKLLITVSCLAAISLKGAIIDGLVPLTNSSFETDAGANNDAVASWFEEYVGTTNAEVIQFEGANANIPDTPHGVMWLNLATRTGTSFNAAVYQSLGIWETGNALSYDISALLGDRSNQEFGTVTFSLYSSDSGTAGAGGTLLSSLTGATELDSQSFDFIESGASTSSTGTFNLDATGIQNTDILWLRVSAFGTEGNQNLVDNISVTAVPEPSVYALFGGILALGWVMVNRRRGLN